MPISTKFIADLLQLDWQGAERTWKQFLCTISTAEDAHVHVCDMSRNKPLQGCVVVVAAWNTKFIIYLQKQK